MARIPTTRPRTYAPSVDLAVAHDDDSRSASAGSSPPTCKAPRRDAVTVPSDRRLLATGRDVRRRLAEVGPEHTRADGDFERVSLPNEDCDALRDLVTAEQARVVIEIGLAYGSSALAIGEAL